MTAAKELPAEYDKSGADLPGSGVGGFRDWRHCQEVCQATRSCNFFVFYSGGGCRLKSAKGAVSFAAFPSTRTLAGPVKCQATVQSQLGLGCVVLCCTVSALLLLMCNLCQATRHRKAPWFVLW